MCRSRIFAAVAMSCLGMAGAAAEENRTAIGAAATAYRDVVPRSLPAQLEWAWFPAAGDPAPDSRSVLATPVVADLDGDGAPEIVFATTSETNGGTVVPGVLRAVHGGSGAAYFTISDLTLRINAPTTPAIGDLDGDGSPEIVTADETGSRLIAFEHDGAFRWRSAVIGALQWAAPSIADLEHDGAPEIVVGKVVLNGDGSIRWTGSGGVGGPVGGLSFVADLDLDGVPEIVAGNIAYRANGSVYWSNPALADGYPALANLDGDNFPEIVLVINGAVRALEHDGTVKWGPVALNGGGYGSAAVIADVDADGEAEIGVAASTRLTVFESSGALKWEATISDPTSGRTPASAFDFGADGAAELIHRDEQRLRVYRGSDGALLFDTPLSSCTFFEYAAVADVDGDGAAEMIAPANSNCGMGADRGIFVYGSGAAPWAAARRVWNQHTYHITNVREGGRIPTTERNVWLYPLGRSYRSTCCPDEDFDARCLAFDCDDDNAATYPGAGEVNDGEDNQCPGDEGRGLVDEITGVCGYFDPLDDSNFSWPPQPGATLYHVARATSRAFTTGCTVVATSSGFVQDATLPSSGGAFFYLVRPAAPFTGSWGGRSDGTARSVPCAP